MSDLVKYTIMPLAVNSGRIDAETLSHYPEIMEGFEPLLVEAKSYEQQAKELKEQFDKLDSVEDKLALADKAKEIAFAVRDCRTKKKGAELVKANFKEVSKGYNDSTDACFNVVETYCKALEGDMQKIRNYAEQLRLEEEQRTRKNRLSDVEQIGAEEFLAEGEDPASYTPENWDARMLQLEQMAQLKKFKEQQEAEEAKRKAQADQVRLIRGKRLNEINAFYDGDLVELSEVDFEELYNTKKAEYDKAEAERLAELAEAKRLAEEAQAKMKLANHRNGLLSRVNATFDGDVTELSEEAFEEYLDTKRNDFEQAEAERYELARMRAEAEAERQAKRKAEEERLKAVEVALQARKDEQYMSQMGFIQDQLHSVKPIIDKLEFWAETYLDHPEAKKDFDAVVSLLEKAQNYFDNK